MQNKFIFVVGLIFFTINSADVLAAREVSQLHIQPGSGKWSLGAGFRIGTFPCSIFLQYHLVYMYKFNYLALNGDAFSTYFDCSKKSQQIITTQFNHKISLDQI